MNWVVKTIEPWMPIGATKAKDDIANIAQETGWNILKIDRADKNVNLSKIKSGDTVLHQFPSYLEADFEEQFLSNVKNLGAKFVILLHDVEPLRVPRKNIWEYSYFNRADLLVVHNPRMRNALIDNKVTTQMISIGVFDYLSRQVESERTLKRQIIYAGTLAKADWLFEEKIQTPIKAYGQIPQKQSDKKILNHVDFIEPIDPNDLPSKIDDGFGLIWDSGSYHQYELINSPHKFSLYLSAGLPVIAWRKSALSEIIRTQHLGWLIDDLQQVDDLVENIDESEYLHFQNNAKKFGNKLHDGTYTKLFLNRITNILDSTQV